MSLEILTLDGKPIVLEKKSDDKYEITKEELLRIIDQAFRAGQMSSALQPTSVPTTPINPITPSPTYPGYPNYPYWYDRPYVINTSSCEQKIDMKLLSANYDTDIIDVTKTHK